MFSFVPVSLVNNLHITDSTRICLGPNRDPGLFVTPISSGIPTKQASKPMQGNNNNDFQIAGFGTLKAYN